LFGKRLQELLGNLVLMIGSLVLMTGSLMLMTSSFPNVIKILFILNVKLNLVTTLVRIELPVIWV